MPLSRPPCTACGSRRVVRNGTHKPSGAQKMTCRDCGTHFRERYTNKAWSPDTSRKVQGLTLQGASIRQTAKRLDVSPQTVWLCRQSMPAPYLSLVRQRCREGVDLLEVRTPLRYPGGKAKALGSILPYVPADLLEYREPFIGGGSVFLAMRALFGSGVRYWINDANAGLCAFWQYVRDDVAALIAQIQEWRERYPHGRKLYQFLVHHEPETLLGCAARFFILNRITFSGVVESGGYSEAAYQQRFTETAIAKLAETAPFLQGVTITSASYETALMAPGESVFLFLDPPYFTAEKLYGQQGDLHTGFDHERFAAYAAQSPHRWCLTYDDAPEIRRLFPFARIRSWRHQYGMNNFRQDYAAKGKELIIMNY